MQRIGMLSFCESRVRAVAVGLGVEGRGRRGGATGAPAEARNVVGAARSGRQRAGPRPTPGPTRRRPGLPGRAHRKSARDRVRSRRGRRRRPDNGAPPRRHPLQFPQASRLARARQPARRPLISIACTMQFMTRAFWASPLHDDHDAFQRRTLRTTGVCQTLPCQAACARGVFGLARRTIFGGVTFVGSSGFSAGLALCDIAGEVGGCLGLAALLGDRRDLQHAVDV